MANDTVQMSIKSPDGFAGLDARLPEQVAAAWSDLRAGIRQHRGWRFLAVEAIKNQYRRTVLGPWWLTLQTAMYVVGLALVFSQLLGSGLDTFLPYVALGFIVFSLLQGVVRAGSQVFVAAAPTMKSTRQPLSVYVLRDLTVEVIQFAHNMIIVVAFFAVGLLTLRVENLLAVPVFGILLMNAFCMSLWLGIAVARFRDVGPAVTSILQVLIFFTPVFYKSADLSGSRRAILDANPFTYFVEAFRGPLLGDLPPQRIWIGLAVITIANAILGMGIFARQRSRLPYWVA